MEQLTRTKVGQFLLKDSLTLRQVEVLRDEEKLDEVILPVDQVFAGYPALTLTEDAARLGYNGNPFRADDVEEKEPAREQVRVYDKAGSFIGIYCWKDEQKLYRPVKMFYEK
jgi:tRNA pseudouridine55 synthase